MLNIMAMVKGDALETRLNVEFRSAMRTQIINKDYTDFQGKGTLTREQFSEDMRLTEKMRRKSNW